MNSLFGGAEGPEVVESLHVEPTGSRDSGPCECCGANTRRVWGFVHGIPELVPMQRIGEQRLQDSSLDGRPASGRSTPRILVCGPGGP